MTSNGKICTNFWNQSTVNFYDTHQLVQQTTSTLEDCLLSKIDIAGYAPFMALDVDQSKTVRLGSLDYLIVSLSNGYVICFNLYTA